MLMWLAGRRAEDETMQNKVTGTDMDDAGSARYESIRQVLLKVFQQNSVPAGLVLLEGPLAQLFGTSRVPVRRALSMLHDEGWIARFEGRGFIVARDNEDVEPVRIALTRELFGLEQRDELVDTRSTGEKVLENLQGILSTAMVFGCYQVDETGAAKHYNTSRAVIRESLMRLRDKGLVEKEPYSQWLTGPLTARELADHFEIRAHLEPAALRKAGERLSVAWLNARLDNVQTCRGKQLNAAELEMLEEDLHIRSLEPAGNKLMMQILRQNQSPFIVTRIFYERLSIPVDSAMLDEHSLVYEFLLKRNWELAGACMRDHLERAQVRTLQRLKVLSVLPVPELPVFMERQ
ncbi:GntR family transcriptional regulator [Pantoea ananatis]|uniref:GntR family transcriptional regulator n=1 Tax=Pantoea ananas TaxID=553 RepID=UPI000CF38FC6|nr:GntR family transcriptional regulator [Pantoea ananatis]MCV3297928.1 GntR family transcriptional regulator [Pantoea ananatis]MDN4126355.1 GntR family transcriptional regulator [Pantoea ananatis]MDN4151668.1 GntR family transcriptional regulator [Pantoea ananatis]PQK87916.1 GntR family transcriptional regulator [Pantoea ananatis]PWK08843.1 GntR family transcriptional regulator [Pantoea ananatis]